MKVHNDLFSKLFLLAWQFKQHPWNTIIKQSPPPRNIRDNITKFEPNITNLLKSINNLQFFKRALKILHTDAVAEAINNYKSNRFLNARPSNISSEETRLPRDTRRRLFKIRTGWSSILNCYRNQLDANIVNRCP